MRWARGCDELSPESLQATRFRPGDLEGHALAFANLYSEFANAFMARSLAPPAKQFSAALPTVSDGVVGMLLIEAARRSNVQGGQWCLTDTQGVKSERPRKVLSRSTGIPSSGRTGPSRPR
jgi:hypothetical protein